MDILQAIRKVRTSIPLVLELNQVCGHQYKSISAQLLDRPSQINIECYVLSKLLVREEWKNNVPIREALTHEIMICKVAGRKMKGDIGKAVCDKRSRRTMRYLLSQKSRMKIKNFNLLDWRLWIK